jgi:hypothetical protein
MNALLKIRDAGFIVELLNDSFKIEPASKLTQNQRDFLKSHRAEIVEELRAEAQPLPDNDRQKLLAYLSIIGETDQDVINEYLTECGRDAAILMRELQQVGNCLKIKSGDTSDLIQCAGCRHLSGDACQIHGWRVVVGKWRRCEAYHPTSWLKTTEICRARTDASEKI